MDAIREKGKDFVLKRLADLEKPLIFPERQKIGSVGSMYSKDGNSTVEFKEKGRGSQQVLDCQKPINSSPVPLSATKVWLDPPKRTQPFKRTRKDG